MWSLAPDVVKAEISNLKKGNMNGRFKSTSSEKFGSAGPTMAMEVPAPPQGVIGSVCGWLYGVFGPGNIIHPSCVL